MVARDRPAAVVTRPDSLRPSGSAGVNCAIRRIRVEGQVYTGFVRRGWSIWLKRTWNTIHYRCRLRSAPTVLVPVPRLQPAEIFRRRREKLDPRTPARDRRHIVHARPRSLALSGAVTVRYRVRGEPQHRPPRCSRRCKHLPILGIIENMSNFHAAPSPRQGHRHLVLRAAASA